MEELIVITGSTGGLGAALARRLATPQRTLVLLGRNLSALTALAAEVSAQGGRAEVVQVDFENPATLTALERLRGLPRCERIGVVLAASTLGPAGGFSACGYDAWRSVFAVNVEGNLAVLRALQPQVESAAVARVALIAGGGAAYAYPLFAAYAASKAATVRIAENLAEEGRIHPNFATVALAPGAMETAMLAKVRAAGAEVRTTVPMEEPVRFLEAFLLSDRCGFSGRFVHVRDPWREWLNGDSEVPAQQWRLRRVE